MEWALAHKMATDRGLLELGALNVANEEWALAHKMATDRALLELGTLNVANIEWALAHKKLQPTGEILSLEL